MNRREVVHIVSALVGNRIVQNGRSVKSDPIVHWAKEGHGRGVLLVPEEWLGPSEPRWDSGVLTDLVIEELKLAFAANRRGERLGDDGDETT